MPWNVVPWVKEPYSDITWIHPYKQQKVEELLSYVRDRYPQITAVVVFGSSTKMTCSEESDLDILICGDKDKQFIPPMNDVYDVVFAQSIPLDARLWDEIERDGVLVYERRAE